MTGPYQIFSNVYDKFMEDVPYDRWCGQITAQLRKYGISDGLLLDLGCGTGQMTRRLRDCGYNMIGADISADMLQQAMEYEYASPDSDKPRILYLNQDMRSFELYGTVRGIVSVCDSMNYLLSEQELLQTFRLADNYLDPAGILLFDMNTIYKYETVIGDRTIAENREHESFIWENSYHPEEQINEYLVTFYIEEADQMYRRYEERHLQRAYPLDQLTGLLEEAGLKVLEVIDSETGGAPSETSERLLFTAQEQKKAKRFAAER